MTVTAEGYYPRTVTFTKEGGDRTLDIHLKPDPGLSGILLDPSGKPVTMRMNGLVTMTKVTSDMTISNGSYDTSRITPSGQRIEEIAGVDRDESGRFIFDTSYEEYHLLSANSLYQ